MVAQALAVPWHDEGSPENIRACSMEPVTFDGCFGWLHAGQSAAAGDVAVLICPGINEDALASHFFLRVLADRFAAAGYPTLRFDYPGTGDSCDVVDEGSIWLRWHRSVQCAIAHLRRVSGARRVVLAGLRIGATLATLVAEKQPDVAGLILLAPVLIGSSYARRLYIQAKLHQHADATQDKAFESCGVWWSRDAVEAVERVDLRRSRLRPGQRMVVYSEMAPKQLRECTETWREAGVEITARGFTSLESIVSQKWRGKQGSIASPDLSGIIDWLKDAVPTRPRGMIPNHGGTALNLPGCRETPLRFGPDQRLFGVLCRPASSASKTVVVIGNTARDPHHGNARFGVETARFLASRGIASLRMDYAGLGDSLGAAGKRDVLTPLFGTNRNEDISAAIDVLEELGYRRFAVQGLCAGAYHMFRGALADARISMLFLLNLPFFEWRGNNDEEFLQLKDIRLRDQGTKLFRLRTWNRLFKGQIDLARLLHAQVAALFGRPLRQGWQIRTIISKDLTESFARHALRQLAHRQARTLFLYSENDHGLNAFRQEIGDDPNVLALFAGASMTVASGFDHTFSRRAMQQATARIMADHLATP